MKNLEEPNKHYNIVLRNIPNIVKKNPRIVDLGLLGSHDSFTHLINNTSGLAHNAPGGLKLLNNTFLLRRMAIRYAKTQLDGPYSQLMAGVRYFDVRLHYMNNTFMIKHSFISGLFSNFLMEILKFLSENTGEVVVFRFYNWKYRDKGQPYLIDFIKSVKFNDKCLFDYLNYKTKDAGHFDTAGLTDTPYPSSKINLLENYDKNEGIYLTELKYNDVTKNGTESGVVLYGWERKPNEDIPNLFYADGYEKARWFHTSIPTEAFAMMDSEVEEMALHYDNITRHLFRVNQANMTMSTKTLKQFIATLKGHSLINMAKNFNSIFIDHENFDKWLHAMPCIWVDYATCNVNDFNNKINAKLFSYNTELCK